MPMKIRQRGASLIEAMIAVSVMGFGLLGLASVQTTTAVLTQSTFYRNVAADLGTDLADRIRALRTPYMASPTSPSLPPKPPDFTKCSKNGTSVSCASQDSDRTTYQALVVSEMNEWFKRAQDQLPNATFTLTKVDSSSPNFFRYTLTLTWLDDRRSGATGTYVAVIE